jgi:erythromycin esterase-like protein
MVRMVIQEPLLSHRILTWDCKEVLDLIEWMKAYKHRQKRK